MLASPLPLLCFAHPVKEIAILGGGLAGGAAAALLAATGKQVHLVERNLEPEHKICGEFLSIEAQRHLAAIGFDTEKLGASRIGTVRLVAGRDKAEAQLPFTGLSVTRRRLDAALLDHAEGLGAKIDRGVTVRRLSDGGVETSMGRIDPGAILLATGKHDVRGVVRNRRGTTDNLVGFKQYFRLTVPARASLDGVVEVVFFDGGYAGLQLVEDGLLNLCLLVSKERLAALGGSWGHLFDALRGEPAIARRVDDAEPLLTRPLTIAGVPYGFLDRGDEPEAFYRLGDQTAVIPSFCGDGMAIALHTARLAGRAVTNGESAADYRVRLQADLASQLRRAMWMQHIGGSAVAGRVAIAALGLAPNILTSLAGLTRISEAALRRAGLPASA
jgi:flavin-dependent dehydrogenase